MSSFYVAGPEDSESERQLKYLDSDVILMCFSIYHDESLLNIQRKWIPEVLRFCPRGTAISLLVYVCQKFSLLVVLVVLVGNQTDWEMDAWGMGGLITEQECLAMAKEIGAYAYVQCMAKTNNGVQEVFQMQLRLFCYQRKGRNNVFCS